MTENTKKATPVSNQVEIEIVNNAGTTSKLSDPYISIFGKVNGVVANFWIQTDGTAVFNDSTKGKDVVQLSTLTSTTLKLDPSLDVSGGRMYFSTSPTVVQSATQPNVTTADFYFDWVEFALTGSKSQLVANTTQVDQFGFPIQLTVSPPDDNFGATAGTLMERGALMKAYKKDVNADYQKCMHSDGGGSYYRILSPNQALVLNPASSLSTEFNASIDEVFTHYSKPGVELYLSSNAAYPYKGLVTTVSEKDAKGVSHDYPVFQFTLATKAPINPGIPVTPTSGKGPYNIYYPFFTTNNPTGHTSFDGKAILPPPAWWEKAPVSSIGNLNPAEPATQMVFAGDGIFSDAFWQMAISGPNSKSELLANLQNQIDVSFNRGYASTWFTLTGSIAPGTYDATTKLYTSTITLASSNKGEQNTPNTNANLSVGMNVISLAASIPLTIATISTSDTQSFTVTSQQPILAYNNLYLTFANIYKAGDTWNQYSEFFHKKTVSIGGRAYALSFDDQGGFSSTLTSNWSSTPSKLTITLVKW